MEAYVASHLKDMNRRKVYGIFTEYKETSKAEIARLTGISAPTVIKIIDFMMRKGLLEELGGGEAAFGRKPQMLRLNKNKYYSVGVILEGDYLKLGITNLANEIVAIRKIKVSCSFQELMSKVLFTHINELLVTEEIRLSDVLGIGIGVPAIYNLQEKTIEAAPLIGVTETTKLGFMLEAIEKKYNKPVYVDNDLNMEVQGEFMARRLGGESDLVYLSVGTGIGSGVILGGKLRRGSRYMCGEVGYMAFLDDYVANNTSAGWLESKVNLTEIADKFGDPLKGEMDEGQRETAVEYVSICLALCINNMMLCFDPENFAVGGEVFDVLGQELFKAIEEKVKRLSVGAPKIMPKLCSEPGIVGAAGVATDSAMKLILGE